jgi:hypothetical protein
MYEEKTEVNIATSGLTASFEVKQQTVYEVQWLRTYTVL